MLRMTLLLMFAGLLSLAAAGCGDSTATVAAPPTQDQLKIAQEEEKRIHEAEMAEQQKSKPAGKR